ncbi:ectonucleotide pyrophosphatase/phosphodiesterase [Paraferrimonas haliotis]|uniref:Alkaline phosphatase family protein n=1 Tax=Paraferrimonas haliotis TaxID=2013866 RepID=A0AA37TT08_9GAMM|nr:ectonucleotide pyrophosphatase/phosphodiesterase [Paraferrimonas haliotis]GLS82584.1 alkaline phosphatase family protein [Paraferrimonas haliotis]
MKKITLLLSFVLASLCVPQLASADESKPTVVMISIDGFRWDYIELHQAKNIAKIAGKGVRAKSLTPVYPTKTFPNHLSIITGLRPANHGIVDNRFCDKTRPNCYKMGEGYKDSSWVSGIPLWNLAEMQGVKAATYYWPESDARINGITPSYFYHYSKHSDYQGRLDQMVAWLKLPMAQRPQFIAGYFSLVDTMGHDFGPESKQTYEAVQFVDGLIGEFAERLANEIDTPVNLVLVSDHGMSEVDPTQSIALDTLPISEDDFTILNGGTRVLLYKKPHRDLDLESIKSKLNSKSDGRFHIVSDEFLQQHGYLNHPRTADIIIETTAPRAFSWSGQVKYRGTHGYQVTKDMGGFFVADGPAFKSQTRIGTVNTLDIYPTLAHILGLALLSPVDSDGASLKQALN